MPAIKVLPPIGNGRYGSPDAESVLKYVLQGVGEANEKLGTNYKVVEIRFVENDSSVEPVYAFISRRLIEHIESGGEFLESNYSDEDYPAAS